MSNLTDYTNDVEVNARYRQQILQTVNPVYTTTTSANPFTNGLYQMPNSGGYTPVSGFTINTDPYVYTWNGQVYFNPSEKLRTIFSALRLA